METSKKIYLFFVKFLVIGVILSFGFAVIAVSGVVFKNSVWSNLDISDYKIVFGKQHCFVKYPIPLGAMYYGRYSIEKNYLLLENLLMVGASGNGVPGKLKFKIEEFDTEQFFIVDVATNNDSFKKWKTFNNETIVDSFDINSTDDRMYKNIDNFFKKIGVYTDKHLIN